MPAPETVRAVATDVDGTILPGRSPVSEATLQAAQALRAAGIPLIVASARVPPIHRIAALHPYIEIAVCSNGSIGFRPATGEQLWRENIPAATLAHAVKIISDLLPDAGIGTRDGRIWMLNEHYYAARGFWPSSEYRVGTIDELVAVAASSMSVCHPAIPAPQLRELLVDAGLGPEILTMSAGGLDILDLAGPGVDKAAGLLRALELLEIDPDDVVAFGDASNDVPMFELVGHAVAMGNAWDDAMAAADAVTGAVEEDGFAAYLDQLGLLDRTGTGVG